MTRALLHDIGLSHEVVEQYVEGNLKEREVPGLGVTCRRLQQTLGTDWGREILSEDFWSRVGATKIVNLLKAGQSVIVDDLRFPNEYEMLKGMGAHLIHVTRPGYLPNNRYEGLLKNHEFEHWIINVGALMDLRNSALQTRVMIEMK